MRYYSADKYLDTDIVFLIEIEYIGRTYRFSSFPLTLTDGDAQILYEGGLEDPAFDQELGRIGALQTSSSNVSLALTFPFNIAQRQIKGKGIERSRATLYYVLSKSGRIQQTQHQKIPIFSGVVTDPIYGHPDRELGYVEFSI